MYITRICSPTQCGANMVSGSEVAIELCEVYGEDVGNQRVRMVRTYQSTLPYEAARKRAVVEICRQACPRLGG